MENQKTYNKIHNRLSDREWRLNNLYWIKDKSGNKVKFKLNWAQQDLYDNRHYFNVILKARQLGFTTFIMIYFLDACLFNSDHSAGVIAHTLDDAYKLFREKIKYAYDNLPESIREAIPAKSDNARTLAFNNGSSIYVGTSLRSGTLQKLLVSEYGKLSAKFPEKAREVKTGALNTIADGQQVYIESTAEGKTGAFFDVCERARKLKEAKKVLARSEPKYFFYAWHMNPEYIATPEEVEHYTIDEETLKYLNSLDVELSDAQMVWYALKADQQDEDMKQEFPSTPAEAFEGSLKGSYYAKQLKKVRGRGQITNVPYNPKYPVYTWWDLGTNDLMTIWFYQYINGRHCFIDYEEASEEGWDFYAKLLLSKDYNYIQHGFPHDGNRRMRGKVLFTDKQCAQEAGIRPIIITPRTLNAHNDVINHCQPTLVNCWFDESKCAKGILHLDNYKKRWCKTTSMFLKEHSHDEASHGADSFRTFAVNADKIGEIKKKKPIPMPISRGSYMG